MFFPRMLNHRFGSRTDSSDLSPTQKNRRPQLIMRRKRRRELRRITKGVKRLTLDPPGKTLTWQQLQTLTFAAEEVLRTSHTPRTSLTFFLALLSVLGPLPVAGESYWAYLPKPPILHPVGWDSTDHIRVLTNQTLYLGGSPDFHGFKNSSGNVNFEGKSDSLPICFSFSLYVPTGCFQITKQVFNSDTPTFDNSKPGGKGDKRRMWELWLTSLGSPEALARVVPVKRKLPPKYPHCQLAYKKDSLWEGDEAAPPRWLPCAFPDNGVSFAPKRASGLLWDFSLSSPQQDQSKKIKG